MVVQSTLANGVPFTSDPGMDKTSTHDFIWVVIIHPCPNFNGGSANLITSHGLCKCDHVLETCWTVFSVNKKNASAHDMVT